LFAEGRDPTGKFVDVDTNTLRRIRCASVTASRRTGAAASRLKSRRHMPAELSNWLGGPGRIAALSANREVSGNTVGTRFRDL
jgi:hypothetical protein